jgi:hypothetical protein
MEIYHYFCEDMNFYWTKIGCDSNYYYFFIAFVYIILLMHKKHQPKYDMVS